jgi:16S rRNA pseudouridine516 synthase
MRLDKYLSNFSGLSRKEARQVIKQGDVLVDGDMITDPTCNIADTAQVQWAGMKVAPAGPRYFMLNKPVGYVCANRDSQHPTVFELLQEDDIESLQVAGRLDIDTTGLVLITDDGQWNHRVTSPKTRKAKIYRVQLAEPIDPSASAQFAQGILLRSEKKRSRPAELEILAPRQVRLTLHEGKYHQVKRMFAALNNHVEQLHRERIAGIVLDEDLAPGEYRALTAAEIMSIDDD